LPLQEAAIRVGFVMHAMQVAGAEVLVRETIHRLAGQIEPTIFCLDVIGAIGEELRREGIEVICLHRRPGRDWRVAWRLAHAARMCDIEVLHAHQYTPFFYAGLARILGRGRPRLILTEHGRHYPDIVSRVRRTANRWVMNYLANAVTACCAFSASGLARIDGFAPGKIVVIENGIEAGHYRDGADRPALRRRLGLEPARRYVACVARFHPVKDHATLVRAFAIVAAARDDVDLLLVGDGPVRGDLEGLTRGLGVETRVHFLGVRSDVTDILQAVDLFALTSVSEAASLTLLEAMAAELPVVVTAVGGNPEIVRHEQDGLLVPRGDAPAAAAAMLRLLANPDAARALGAAGRARVAERYQLARTIERYHDLYRRCCPRRLSRSRHGVHA
jgi:glycosyltransferase involved in cell wall biosynthesis